MDDLLAAATMRSTEEQVALYCERERAAGHVAMLGQLLAGAQTNPVYAMATREALQLWIVEIEEVLRRVLADSVPADAG